MKVSIIREDKAVVVDGKAKFLTRPEHDSLWAQLSPAVHAVQLSGAVGEIEWVSVMGGRKPANQRISYDEFNAMFKPLVDAWKAMPEVV